MPPDHCRGTVEYIKNTITSDDFINKHKTSPSDFTKKRKLPFHVLLLLLINLLRSSLQNELDIFFKQIKNDDMQKKEVTASALCQARRKLKHGAFIELSHGIVDHFYSNFRFKTWNGFRLLAADGSTIKVPRNQECSEHFGALVPRQGESCPMARVSQCFDVLNHITIDSIIESRSVGERELARRHFEHIKSGDLVLLDRGYPAFWLFSLILNAKADFCARIPVNRWTIVKRFVASGLSEQVIDVESSTESKKKCAELGLSTTPLKLRLIRIDIKGSEEPAILITSLIDSSLYSIEIFYKLYHQRWPVEENYKILKSRIEIENFTGKNVEAVLQDFYARTFICNLTSILAFDVHEVISEKYKESKHSYKINWTQAFAKMRNFGILLFFRENILQVIKSLQEIFSENVSAVRDGRKFPRKHKVSKKIFAMPYKPIS